MNDREILVEESHHFSTRREEYANILTHGVGAVLSLIALCLMVGYAVREHEAKLIAAVSIFGASLLLLYLMSTLYHVFQDPRRKHFFRILDHSSIYLLIAGSYTPFTLVFLEGRLGKGILITTWVLAVCGIVFKVFFVKRFNLLSTGMYVAMGWLAIFAIKPLIEAAPTGAIVWLVAGGVLYTLGVIFYLWHRLPYNHAIWHLFVMGGSFSHFCAVYWYVLPLQIGVV
jgi:hemolysin III